MKLYCKCCSGCIGSVPFEVLWTGSVERFPYEPDGLVYVPCRKCRTFQRFEVVAPENAPPPEEIAA